MSVSNNFFEHALLLEVIYFSLFQYLFGKIFKGRNIALLHC